jgi:hypothetical protein
VDRAQEVRERSEVVFDFRWFDSDEVERLAADAGLVVHARWGDFSFGSFDDDSEQIVYDLRKP